MVQERKLKAQEASESEEKGANFLEDLWQEGGCA